MHRSFRVELTVMLLQRCLASFAYFIMFKVWQHLYSIVLASGIIQEAERPAKEG